MTPFSCQQLDELVDELALDALSGDLRGLALEHLERCPACRATVEALSQIADELLLACAATEPPAGFADRVLARLAVEQNPPGQRPRTALVLIAAAAAVLAVAAGVGTIVAKTGGHHATAANGGHQLRIARLLSSTGQAVGDLSAYAGRPAWFFMTVDHGVPPGIYECVLGFEGNTNVAIGTLTVADGKGAWGEHLAIDARHLRSARLVTANGTTIATASFP